MPLRDEKTFTDDEFAQALRLVMPKEQAWAEATALNSAPDLKGFESTTPEELRVAPVRGPRSYDGALLDLLSLVSDDCARRAWALLGITVEEGMERRATFRQRLAAIGGAP